MIEEFKSKVVLLGSTGVGKTTLISRIISNSFLEKPSSISAEAIRFETEKDGKKISFTFWDTAGQEKYKSLSRMCLKGANIAIFVFDITRNYTLSELFDYKIMIENTAPIDCKIILIGNKQDLEMDNKISTKDIMDFGENLNSYSTLLVSSKTGNQIDVLLDELIDITIQIEKIEAIPEIKLTNKDSLDNSIQNIKVNNKKQCCYLNFIELKKIEWVYMDYGKYWI